MNDFLRTILFLPPQASTIAWQIDTLHYFVILTTMGGATFITIVGGIFLIKYRRPGKNAEPTRQDPAVKTPVWLEASVVVFLLTLFCVWWGVGFSQYMKIRIAPKNTYDIYVTAKQWMWKFSYPDGSHTITKLYVPARKPVKLIMTARDVIHSFYVPDFRLKQDVVPGRYTTLWFEVKEPGTHQILCAEYCGTGHSQMRGEVIALEPEDFARWLAGGQPNAHLAGPRPQDPSNVDAFAPDQTLSMVRVGEEAAATDGCLRCHTLDGSPHIGPTWAGLYGQKVTLKDGSTVIADDAYLTESMMDPLVKIVRGFEPVMPSYHGILRPGETAALLELIKSIRDVPIGQAPGPLHRQPYPPVGAPPAAEKGLPPPGIEVMPPVQGTIEVKP